MTKETMSTRMKRISIFMFTPPNVTPSKATVVNRRKSVATTDHLHLFYSDMTVTGATNKAGTAKFTVTNTGDATSDELSLIVADTLIAIVSGYDVIWSGKILRCNNSTSSLYQLPAGSRYSQWSIECESDISRMKTQTVNVSSRGRNTAPVGTIVSTLVARNTATDINWNGDYEAGVISAEGPLVTYNITDSDMYSQFVSLANLSGFDWRTRMLTWIGAYSTWVTATNLITLPDTCTPYPADALNGKWVLFIHDLNSDTTANTLGVVSYGKVSTHTTSVFTMTGVINGDVPPAATSNIIVLVDPVLDFAWSLMQETATQTVYMMASRSDSTKYYGYMFNDKTDTKALATKVVANCKSIMPTALYKTTGLSPTGSGISNTASVALAAKDAWDETTSRFLNSTFVTYRMDGYVYSYAANATDIYLIGTGYALQVNDDVYVYYIKTDGTVGVTALRHVHAVAVEKATDGTDVTKVTISASFEAFAFMKYSVFIACKTYINKKDDVTTAAIAGAYFPFVYMGNELRHVHSNASDAIYGEYFLNAGSGDAGVNDTPIYPHQPGCLVSLSAYSGSGGTSEGSPSAQSPLKVYGLIMQTITVDQMVTYSELDIYATQALISNAYYMRKASYWSLLPDFTKPSDRGIYQLYFNTLIREGDKVVALKNADETYLDILSDGQYENQWKVDEWTLNANELSVKVQLGEVERNVFTLMASKIAALDRTIT